MAAGSNAAIASTTYLMIVLVVAATSRLRVAVATSIAAMLSLHFFFLPPVGHFAIADPHNWVALFAFLAVSLVASNLSAVAHARTEEAVGRRTAGRRRFGGRCDDRQPGAMVVRPVVAVASTGGSRSHCRGRDWDVFEPSADDRIDGWSVACVRGAQRSLEFDAIRATTLAMQGTMAAADPAGDVAGRPSDRCWQRWSSDRGRHPRPVAGVGRLRRRATFSRNAGERLTLRASSSRPRPSPQSATICGHR